MYDALASGRTDIDSIAFDRKCTSLASAHGGHPVSSVVLVNVVYFACSVYDRQTKMHFARLIASAIKHAYLSNTHGHGILP